MNRETLILKSTLKTGLNKVIVKLTIVVLNLLKRPLVVNFYKITQFLNIKLI